MGGTGSGRHPSEETIVKRMSPEITPVGDSMFIPNYSGIQTAALKTSKPLGTAAATGGGHTIQDEGVSETQRTKLNFSGSAVSVTDDAVNDATIVHVDAVGGTSDHSALSNLDYASAAHTGFTSSAQYNLLSGSFQNLSGSYYTAADPGHTHTGTSISGLSLTDDITAGTNKIFQTKNTSAIVEISLGNADTYLKSNGAGNDLTWTNTLSGTHYGDGSNLSGVTASSVQVFGGSAGVSQNSGSTSYYNVDGSQSSTEANVQIRMPPACTISNPWIYISANGVGLDSSFNIRDDNVSVLSTIIAASTTGEFSNDVSGSAIAANSLINYGITTGAQGTTIFTRSLSCKATI